MASPGVVETDGTQAVLAARGGENGACRSVAPDSRVICLRAAGGVMPAAWGFVPELPALPVVPTALVFVSPVGHTFWREPDRRGLTAPILGIVCCGWSKLAVRRGAVLVWCGFGEGPLALLR